MGVAGGVSWNLFGQLWPVLCNISFVRHITDIEFRWFSQLKSFVSLSKFHPKNARTMNLHAL